MWYEILPSAAIIFGAMAIPHFSAYLVNKGLFGNVSADFIAVLGLQIHSLSLLQMYRRKLTNFEQVEHYVRDRRLTDNPYIMRVRRGRKVLIMGEKLHFVLLILGPGKPG